MELSNLLEHVEAQTNSRQSEVIERLVEFCLLISEEVNCDRSLIFDFGHSPYVALKLALKLAAHRLRRKINNDFYDDSELPKVYASLGLLETAIKAQKEARKRQRLLDREAVNPYSHQFVPLVS